MVDIEIIRTVFGIIGNVISFGQLAWAVPTFYRIVKNNSVKGVKPEYHLALTMNCFFCVFYGTPFIHPGFILVLTAYGIVLATQLAYIIIFLFYGNDNKQRMYVGGVFLIELVVISLFIGSVLRLEPTDTGEIRRRVVGMFCVGSGAVVSLIDFFCMVGVAKLMTRGTVECEQSRFAIVVGNTLYGLCWTIYASLKFDDMLWITNFVGLIWGVVKLKIYDVYYKRYAKAGADKKLATAELPLQDKKLLRCRSKEWAQVLIISTAEVQLQDKKLLGCSSWKMPQLS